MNYTDNYNLNLPSFNDSADISTLNENFSKIDEKLKDNAEAIANVKITTDTTVKEGSTNPVSGGAVYEALQNVETDVDDEMSDESTNPVQNKVIMAYVDDKQDLKLADDKTQQISFKKNDDKLIAVTKTKNEITLDNIAYDNMTYRDIFVDNNLISWGNFESEIDGLTIISGNPEITSDAYQSGTKSLKCFGSISQQLRKNLSIENVTNGYCACSVKVDRYEKGELGVQIVADEINYYAKISNENENFERVSVSTLGTPTIIYVGSFSSANLDGYVDDVVFIDLSVFSTIPSKEIMDILYDNYIKIVSGQVFVENEESFTISDEKIEIDNTMSDTSQNPVQNNVVKKYVDAVDKKTEPLQISILKEEGANIFDEEKNSEVNPSDAQYIYGTVYLEGTEGFVVISTKGNYKGSITPIKLYDSSDTEIDVGEIIGLGDETTPRSGQKITIPSNARRLWFQYRIKSSTQDLCSEMMVTIGETLPTEYKPCEYVNTLKGSPYLEHKDIDNEMSDTSTNPVQNKIVKAYIAKTTGEMANEIEIDKINLDNSENYVIGFKEDNNNLMAIVKEMENVTLDDIAIDGKTYRDIFETNNLTPWGNFENGWGSAAVNAGTPEITSEDHNGGSKSLKCFGTVSNQLKATISSTISSEIYYACSVRMDRYTSGQLGVQVSTGGSTHATIQNKNSGFERKSVCVTIESYTTVTLFIGSINSANLDGYVDDVVAIDLSIFSTKPTQEQMDALYDNYVQIIKGEKLVKSEKKYVIADRPLSSVNLTDDECISAFMEKVNEKATELGMINSYFVTPSGAGTENLATSKDLVRLFVGATAYDDLMKVWGKDTKVVTTKNDIPKEVILETTVANAGLDDYYYIFGGKTGSWTTSDTTIYNLGVIGEVAGKMVVGICMKGIGSSNRFVAMREMFDIAKQVIENPDTDISALTVKNAESCCCCILPEYNVNMYENYPFKFLFEQNADTQIIPASVTKVITSMVMLDYVKDLDETFEFISSDLIGGSGAVFSVGDIITYKDGLYALMLPSSNMTAQAIARCVGKKILEKV